MGVVLLNLARDRVNYLKAIKELGGIFQNKIDLIRDETLNPKMENIYRKRFDLYLKVGEIIGYIFKLKN